MNSTTVTCPQCQSELQPGMLRCRNCGHRIPKTPAATGSALVSQQAAVSPADPRPPAATAGITPPRDQSRESRNLGGTSFSLETLPGINPAPAPTRPASKPAPKTPENPAETSGPKLPAGGAAASSPAPPAGTLKSPPSPPAEATSPGKVAARPVRATETPRTSAIIEIPTEAAANSSAAAGERLTVTCVCAARFRVKPELAGRRMQCPKCQQALTVPSSPDQPTATVSGRLSRVDLPKSRSFDELAAELADQPPLMAEVPVLKEKLGKSRLKKLAAAIEKKSGDGKAEAEQRRQTILEIGRSADSRAVGLLQPLISDYWISVREGLAEALGELRDPAGVPILIQLLGDEVPDVRRQAILSLGKTGDARAVVPLLEIALQEPQLRFTAGETITRMGKLATPLLSSVLQDVDPGRALEAVIVLGRIKDPDSAEPLGELLTHPFTIIRGHAAEALGQISNPKSGPVLIRALGDAEPVVRMQAAAALYRIKDQRAVDPLIRLLGDVDADVCQKAAMTLGELGDGRATEPLLPLLQHPAPDVRGAAVDALGKLGDEAAAEPLTRLFHDPDENVRLKAVSAFRRFKSTSAMAPLILLLDDPNTTIRQKAADALGDIGNVAALDRLIVALKTDGAVEVRMSAARALGQLRSAKALKSLEAALDDEMAVRCRAVTALGDIGDASSLPALLAMLKDATPEIRYHASQALAEIGHQNSRKPLEELLSDDSTMVRRGAAKALIKLGDPRGEQLLEDAVEVRKARPRNIGQFADYVPDWLLGVLMPSSPGGRAVAAGVPVLLLIGVALWYGGPALMGLVKGPEVLVLTGDVACQGFSPDGSRLAVGRSFGLLEIWDTASGRQIDSYESPNRGARIDYLAYATDGKTLIMISGKDVYQLVDGTFKPLTPHTQIVRFFSATPGGSTAVSYSEDGATYVWDLDSGAVKSSLSLQVGRPTAFAAAADGSMIAVGTADQKLFLFNSTKGEILKTIDLKGRPERLGFSADGKILAVQRNDAVLEAIDTATGKAMGQLAGEVSTASFRTMLVTSTSPPRVITVQQNKVKQLQLPDFKPVEGAEFPAQFGIDLLAISTDGKLLAAAAADEPFTNLVDLSAKETRFMLGEE